MTAEEILNKYKYLVRVETDSSLMEDPVPRAMVEFAIYHCNQQLYEILNNIELVTDKDVTTEGLVVKVTVNTKSIVNAYPLEQIK